jgi:exosome complex RNA-binding protein Rrp42 (RNase PH superfamily)
MILSPCSAAERGYVQLGVAQGVRNDGRAAMDCRPVTVDAGVLPHANGSARVTLGKGLIGGSGGTDVVAAIKAEVGRRRPNYFGCTIVKTSCTLTFPFPVRTMYNPCVQVMVPSAFAPLDGSINIAVDCAASLFVGVRNRRDAREEVNAELTSAVRRFLADSLPLASLGVMPGRFAWRLFVDVSVLQVCSQIGSSVLVSSAVHSQLAHTSTLSTSFEHPLASLFATSFFYF